VLAESTCNKELEKCEQEEEGFKSLTTPPKACASYGKGFACASAGTEGDVTSLLQVSATPKLRNGCPRMNYQCLGTRDVDQDEKCATLECADCAVCSPEAKAERTLRRKEDEEQKHRQRCWGCDSHKRVSCEKLECADCAICSPEEKAKRALRRQEGEEREEARKKEKEEQAEARQEGIEREEARIQQFEEKKARRDVEHMATTQQYEEEQAKRDKRMEENRAKWAKEDAARNEELKARNEELKAAAATER